MEGILGPMKSRNCLNTVSIPISTCVTILPICPYIHVYMLIVIPLIFLRVPAGSGAASSKSEGKSKHKSISPLGLSFQGFGGNLEPLH